jgi:hypothetical protein
MKMHVVFVCGRACSLWHCLLVISRTVAMTNVPCGLRSLFHRQAVPSKNRLGAFVAFNVVEHIGGWERIFALSEVLI